MLQDVKGKTKKKRRRFDEMQREYKVKRDVDSVHFVFDSTGPKLLWSATSSWSTQMLRSRFDFNPLQTLRFYAIDYHLAPTSSLRSSNSPISATSLVEFISTTRSWFNTINTLPKITSCRNLNLRQRFPFVSILKNGKYEESSVYLFFCTFWERGSHGEANSGWS